MSDTSDTSGEHALAKACEVEELITGDGNGNRGVVGHLHALDVALYKRDVVWRAVIGLLAVCLVLTAVNAWLTVQRSGTIATIERATVEVVKSEQTNQQLNQQMLDLARDIDASAEASEVAAVEVAEYVRAQRAATAASGGQSAEVARRLQLIDQIAAALGIDVQPEPPGDTP